MKITVESTKKVFFVTLLCQLELDTEKNEVKVQRYDLYQGIEKTARNEQEAVLLAMEKAKFKPGFKKFALQNVAALTPEIFVDKP